VSEASKEGPAKLRNLDRERGILWLVVRNRRMHAGKEPSGPSFEARLCRAPQDDDRAIYSKRQTGWREALSGKPLTPTLSRSRERELTEPGLTPNTGPKALARLRERVG
jgi:hypothetical protein